MEYKTNLENISITLSKEILKKLDDGKYNKSKLIDSLLTEYFEKNKKK
jgi:metal-responsive CopG/Arc/MetJ family transcriptional regulator